MSPPVIKISSKSIPDGMSYDAFVAVYRQLLVWIKSITPLSTDREGDAGRDGRATTTDFLGDHARLQRCLKASKGSLEEAQKRIMTVVEKLSRAEELPDESASASAASTPAPTPRLPDSSTAAEAERDGSLEMNAEPGTQHVVQVKRESSPDVDMHPDADIASCTRASPPPTAPAPVSMISQARPPSPSPRSPPSNTSSSSLSSSNEDEAGIATLLMLRRRKNTNRGTLTLPAPLLPLSKSRKVDEDPAKPTSHPPKSGKTPRTGRLPTSGLPSSHPYYRSRFVLASPSLFKESEQPSRRSERPLYGRLPSPRSSTLTKGVPDLQPLHAQTVPSTPAQGTGASTGTTLPPSVNSPRIFIPPLRFSPHTRRASHFRSLSDAPLQTRSGTLGSGSAAQLRFIAPLPPTRRRGSATSEDEPREHTGMQPQAQARKTFQFPPLVTDHPARTPARESFLRTPMRGSFLPEQMSASSRPLVYEPCGNVETRRISPQSARGVLDGEQGQGKPTRRVIHPLRPSAGRDSESIGRYGAAPPVVRQHGHGTKRAHQTSLDGRTTEGLRFISPFTDTEPDAKRLRTDSDSTATSSSSPPSSSTRRYIIPPPSRGNRPAYPPLNTAVRMVRHPLHSGISSAGGPSSDAATSISSGTGSRILDALIGELHANSPGGARGESAAQALEEVAARLSAVARRLRERQ